MIEAEVAFCHIGQLNTCQSPHGPKKGRQMSDTGEILNATVAVANGRIVYVGSTTQARHSVSAPNWQDCTGTAMVPGLVDCHTHIVYAGDRAAEFEQRIMGVSYLEIMAAGGGIMSTTRAVRAASQQHLAQASLARCKEMAALGVTSLEIKTGYGLTVEDELKMLRAIEQVAISTSQTIVPTFLGAHAIPAEYKTDPTAYTRLVVEQMLPAAWQWYTGSVFSEKGIPFYCDVFCEQNAFSLADARDVLQAAHKLGFGIKIHSDEFTSMGGIGLGIEMGASSIDHLDAANDGDIAALANSDSVAVLLPGVNFNLGSAHFARGRDMIDAGCSVALSTDINPGSCPSPSLPLMMAIAARYQRLTPNECLNACTINAAWATGLGKTAGSIEVGKDADFVLLKRSEARFLAYEFGGNPILAVYKHGKQIA